MKKNTKKQKISFAEVSWCYEDVQKIQPDWSKEQCNALLNEIEDTLQPLMIGRGWSVLESAVATEVRRLSLKFYQSYGESCQSNKGGGR